ncbi:SDR family oxidoreductase [Frigidibacter sp. MR17.14]|uniref:SDR family NAD(P)-dependent oxidoreductase n=1 Tax=Frigidibacter sp. MR17.14 TaxID=3126509 RepID=UPI003012DF94
MDHVDPAPQASVGSARPRKGRVEDKVVLVFGAGSVGEGWGNGKAASVAYAREGGRVVCVDLNAAAAETTAAAIAAEGGEALALTADVTQDGSIRAAVAAALERFGRIDVLHNNVGMNIAGGAVEATEESWRRVMDVNLTSAFLTCRAVLPAMVAQGKGAIVNVSSLAGIRWTGYPYISYAAAKAGLNQMTRSIAVEYAARGIRCNVVLPGLMDTPHVVQQIAGYHAADLQAMRDRRAAMTPMKVQGDGWDIAWASVFLASDEAKFVNGIELIVDGGQHCTMMGAT